MSRTEVIHGGDVERVCREYGLIPEQILDYSANINPLPLPQGMSEYIAANLDSLARYPDREYHRLRKALARYTGCPASWIMVGNGATELIYLAAKALRPSKVLIPGPSFADFSRAFTIQGSKVDLFPLREEADFKLDVPAFIAQMAQGYEAVVLCNPNNPTGQLLRREELLEIVTAAKNLKSWVLLDETFIEFVANSDQVSLLQDLAHYDNLLILRALTKYFGVPGLRLGYGLAKPDLLNKLEALQEPWTVNAMAALLGPWLLEQQDYIESTRQWITRERPFFLARLREIKQLKVFEGQANFILCKLLTRGWNVKALQRSLEGLGIMIRDASSFPGLNDKFFRLAVRERTDNLQVAGELDEFLQLYEIEKQAF